MSTGSTAARHGKTFSAGVTASTARDGFAVFRREWDAQVGEAWPLPGPDIGGSGDFRMDVRAVGVGDADDRVQMHLTRHGAWHFARPDGPDETITVPAGSFIARHDGPPTLFRVDPGTTAKILILPAPVLRPLTGGRQVVGSARSAEARVLMAHASTVSETMHDLTPAGVQSARDALLELAKGALIREFDDAEPRLAPALARAAMEIADNLLASPELSPASLARELNVSVRTLHRAFATAGESVAAYVRRRRLERARLELAVPSGRPDVGEVAARWQFADSSHFIRAFRKRYGQTPAQFARPGRTHRGTAQTGSGNDAQVRDSSTASPNSKPATPTASATPQTSAAASASPAPAAPDARQPGPPARHKK